MKKILSAILAVCLLLGATACGGGSEPVELKSTGCRVYVSSENQTGGMYAIQATDGNDSTSWGTSATSGAIDEFITIDLGQNMVLSSVELLWGNSRAIDYTVSVSRGGLEFTQVYEKKGADQSVTDDILTTAELGENTVARYIKVHVTQIPATFAQTLNIGVILREFKVYAAVAKDQSLGSETAAMVITEAVVPEEGDVTVFGRSNRFNRLKWAGSGLEFQVTGTAVGITMTTRADDNIFASIDGGDWVRMKTESGTHEYLFADDLADSTHTVQIKRDGDPWTPEFTIENILIEEKGELVKGFQAEHPLKIEFIGDSITSAQGVDYCDSYPALTAKHFDAHFNVISLSGQGLYLNSNLGKADGLMKDLYVKVNHNEDDAYAFGYNADVVVLNIGTNDGGNVGRSITDQAEKDAYMAEFNTRYDAMLEKIHAENPQAAIVPCYGLMGVNPLVEQAIQDSIARFSAKYANVKIEYLKLSYMEDVSTEENGMGHPGVGGHKKAAEELTAHINKLLGQ